MKRNGETVEYQVTLNIPHLRGKNQQNLRESPCFLREWRKPVRKNAFWLSLWESWRGAPERARMLTEKSRRSDSIALPKRQLIAVRRLSGDGLALSVSLRSPRPGCGSQRLLRCRLHPAGRCPNSSSLFPPLAAVVAVAPRGGAIGRPGNFELAAESLIGHKMPGLATEVSIR